MTPKTLTLGYLVELRYPRKALIFGAFVALVVSAWCFMQTEYFLKNCTSYPTDAEIKKHMSLSKNLQDQVSKNSKHPGPTKPISTFYFSEDEEKLVEKARDEVVNDQDLEKVLQDKFGVSLKDVKVVVVPAWRMDMKDYCQEVGITYPAGWQELENAKAEAATAATVRDREPNQIRTLDGVPRVFLMANAFTAPPKSLQHAMAHELLHALNIPAYRLRVRVPGFEEPVPVTRMQTDLSYLAEYKWYLSKAGLEVFDQNIAGVLTGSFLILFLINLGALLYHHRRRISVQ